jgi:hypothetical protein
MNPWFAAITAVGVILAALGGAIVTAVSVSRTQERADKRERESREFGQQEEQRKREHELKLAQLENAWKTTERWRTDRINAHRRMLTALDSAYSKLLIYVGDARELPRDATAPVAPYDRRLSSEQLNELQDALSEIDLLAGETARLFAKAAHDALQDVDTVATLGSRTAGEVDELFDRFYAAQRRYIVEARKELGTHDPASVRQDG